MKQKIILSLLISLGINLVGMLINFVAFKNTNHLPLAIKMPGGECLLEIGFGLRVFHTYAMRMGDSDSVSFRLAPITFIIQLIVIAGIILLIILLINKLRQK